MTAKSDIHVRHYDSCLPAALRAAERVLPIVLAMEDAGSVVDVGCGPGAWTRAARAIGVPTVVGIDGEWARPWSDDRNGCFLSHDLTEPLHLRGGFDLAISLEVAQYLPASRAPDFVAELCSMAPRILFSSRIPHQPDYTASNGHWPSWWATLFAQHGRVPVDVVRPVIWNDSGIPWYYRQNILLFSPSDGATASSAIDLVHPDLWIECRIAHSPRFTRLGRAQIATDLRVAVAAARRLVQRRLGPKS